MDQNNEDYEQKIAYGRPSLWAPFYTVGMIARLQGDVPAGLLENALRKLRILHPPLASRVRLEKDGTAWLTTGGVGEFPLEIRSRTSADDWVKTTLEQERLPFNFSRGPLARFILLHSDQSSDLVAVVPHVICDASSMIQVMWDAVSLLNDPERMAEQPSPPPAVSWQNMPHSVFDNLLLRGLVRVLNQAWRDSRLVLHQDEYEELNRRYWACHQNGMLAFEFSPAETSGLAARCKQRGISITGTLIAAFLLAQSDIRPATQTRRGISIAVSIRDRLVESPGRAVGVYASSLELAMRPRLDLSFWELACLSHARIHKELNDRARILMPMVLEEVDPLIADRLVAAVSTGQWSREVAVMNHFIKFRDGMRALDISNIGRIDLDEAGTSWRLEDLFPFPPLVPGGGLALNVLTVNGHMNILLKFRQDELGYADAARIRDQALGYLSSE
jgi:hypothetical protein